MRKPSKEFIDRINAQLVSSLTTLGFKKRSSDFLTYALSKEFLGTVALSRAVEQGEKTLLLVPQIGITSTEVEKALKSLTGERFQSTIVKQLGYLLPGHTFKNWSFSEHDPCDETIENIVAGIKQFAIPFFLDHQSLAAICGKLETMEYPAPVSCELMFPIALALLNQKERAKVFILKRLTELKKDDKRRNIPIDIQHGFYAFALKFSKHYFIEKDSLEVMAILQ